MTDVDDPALLSTSVAEDSDPTIPEPEPKPGVDGAPVRCKLLCFSREMPHIVDCC
jgi:hypothetical protein